VWVFQHAGCINLLATLWNRGQCESHPPEMGNFGRGEGGVGGRGGGSTKPTWKVIKFQLSAPLVGQVPLSGAGIMDGPAGHDGHVLMNSSTHH